VGVSDCIYPRETSDSEIRAQWIAEGHTDGTFDEPRMVHDEYWGYVFTDVTSDGVNDIVGHAPSHDIDDPRSYVVVLDVAGGGEGQALTQTHQLPDNTFLTLAAQAPGEPLVAFANFRCRAPCDDACTGQCVLGGCIP
jgi:hypothetical protein